MSERHGGWTTTVSARRYRWLDRASKLLGVVLIGAGLHVGGGTLTGVALAALGVVSGLLTVIFDRQ
jgi:hypothetical protein